MSRLRFAARSIPLDAKRNCAELLFIRTMAAETNFELAHVLFMDVVGYSKTLIDDQREVLRDLNEIVQATDQFQSAEAEKKLICLVTGDGMALAFFTSPGAPARCALEITRALRERPEIKLRMGIHSGPVSRIDDVNKSANVAGGGINMAQRVMDCGDAGHILLSQRVAEDLAQFREWSPSIHDLGECEVKHGAKLHLFNFFGDGFGNAAMPARLHKLPARPTKKKSAVFAGLILIIAAVLGFLLFYRVGMPLRGVPRNEEGRPAGASLPGPDKSMAVNKIVPLDIK